jgi:hypothetical protein
MKGASTCLTTGALLRFDSVAHPVIESVMKRGQHRLAGIVRQFCVCGILKVQQDSTPSTAPGIESKGLAGEAPARPPDSEPDFDASEKP